MPSPPLLAYRMREDVKAGDFPLLCEHLLARRYDPPSFNLLVFAAQCQDPDIGPLITKLLIEKGGRDPNKKTKDITPILMASQNGYAGTVRELLLHNADPDITIFEDNTTPLFMASQNNHIEVVKLLLEMGHANPNIIETTNHISPVLVACSHANEEVVELLLKHGADPNIPSISGTTALEMAILHGNVRMLQALGNAGADVNREIKETFSRPIFVASIRGLPEIVDKLVQFGADLQATTLDGVTALHVACKAGQVSVVDYLVNKVKVATNKRTTRGETPLSFTIDVDKKPVRSISVLQLKY